MKHIKLYFIALLIACSMFMVCPFAYADDSFNPYSILSLEDALQYNGYVSETNYNTILNTFDTYCPYYMFYLNSSTGAIYAQGTNYNNQYVALIDASDSIYKDADSYFLSSNNTDLSYIYLLTVSGNGLVRLEKVTPGNLGNWYVIGDLSQYNISSLYQYYDNSNMIINDFNGTIYLNNLYAYVMDSYDVLLQYNGNENPNLASITPLNISSNHIIDMNISYSSDDRLKLYKLWSSQNGDSLVVDLSAFRTYTPAAAYEFSDIVITLTTNGVDTDYNLPLASSTINNGWDNNSNLYIISTPVSNFTLSESYDTYISKVSFTLDYSSPGGSGSTPFYISVNFPLDVHHSNITPDTIPTPATIYDDPAKPIDISDRQYDLFQQLQSNVAGGDIVYVNNYPVLPSWANVYNLNTFFYDNNPDDLNIYHGVQITGNYFIDSKYDFDIKTFLYDNAISAYYDVVIIRIDNTVWPSVVTNNTIPDSQQLYGYVVLYTSTYYMRLDAETQINILEAIQLDAKQSIENWNWLVEKMDDFEDKSLQVLNPLYDEVTYIDDKLASILYAVNNIESYNDSSIVTLLTDIKGLLSSPENEIDTPQECIQLYEAHPDYFNELWGTPTPALRSASVTPSPNNPYISSDYVRADLIPAWWEGKTLTMVYILKNDGDTSRFYDSILGGLFDAYENLIESDSSFTNYIDSLFKTGYDYTDSFYGHLFDLNYDPEEWEGGFGTSE